MTVLEGIKKSTEFLSKKQVESARLQAELLLATVLKLPRMKLYLSFDRVLTADETDKFREMVRRRGQREPLQHIVGSTSFCGFEMAVNRNVLVPRPETELLAEFGWRFLSGIPPGSKALDIGTGSGCIAIALAVKCPDAKVIATDISSEALAVAAQNAETENLNGRISFIQSDLFAAVPSDQQFDLIISNPPYIPSAEIKTLQPEVRDFDPRMALDGGSDGLEFYRRIACESRPFLRTGGKIMLEFGDGQSDAVRRHFEDQKWIVEAIHQDYNQRPRILIARL